MSGVLNSFEKLRVAILCPDFLSSESVRDGNVLVWVSSLEFNQKVRLNAQVNSLNTVLFH